jgi:hypothetical protein
LKAVKRGASFSSELDPSPQSIGMPTIPEGGDGLGVQSIIRFWRVSNEMTYRNTIQACP